MISQGGRLLIPAQTKPYPMQQSEEESVAYALATERGNVYVWKRSASAFFQHLPVLFRRVVPASCPPACL